MTDDADARALARDAPSVGDAREAPECLACGACCFSMLETYVAVTGDDYARLGERARVEELTHFVGNRAFMKMKDGRCAALVVDRESARFVCSVYEARPSVCRELARGSLHCTAERAAKADRPLVALRAASRAKR